MSRIRSLVIATSALVALSATPALAKGAFDGAYAGLQGGWSFVTPDADHSFPGTTATTSTDKTSDGVNGGIYAGFGQTFDRLYVGAEVEAGYSDADGIARSGLNRYSFEANESYGVAARLGYLVTDTALVYGRLGWQRTDVDFTGTRTSAVVGAPAVTGRFSGDLDGVRYGAGTELALGHNLLVRAEYSYTDYENLRVAYPSASGSSAVDAHENLVRVGVAYRF
ncbi:MAG TPA: outer membrane beta-barrel protein [Azospirillaceae bacterium]|nr:outer membrane beta-barrel protein [Azospirillaceae bacterium]